MKLVKFKNRMKAPVEIASILWDFGDGQTSTEMNPTHNFSESRCSYTITQTITDINGNTYSKEGSILLDVTPNSNFRLSSNMSSNSVVSFTDRSSSPNTEIESYLWDFGDGNTSTLQNPTNTYTDEGNYPVKLTVTDIYGKSSQSRKYITITDDGKAQVTDFDHYQQFWCWSEGPIYNYQKSLNIGKKGWDPYMPSANMDDECTNWPNDIRFFASGTTVELGQWYEYTDVNYSIIWVKYPRTSTYMDYITDGEYRIYYGDVDCTFSSNAQLVFDNNIISGNTSDLIHYYDYSTNNHIFYKELDFDYETNNYLVDKFTVSTNSLDPSSNSFIEIGVCKTVNPITFSNGIKISNPSSNSIVDSDNILCEIDNYIYPFSSNLCKLIKNKDYFNKTYNNLFNNYKCEINISGALMSGVSYPNDYTQFRQGKYIYIKLINDKVTDEGCLYDVSGGFMISSCNDNSKLTVKFYNVGTALDDNGDFNFTSNGVKH